MRNRLGGVVPLSVPVEPPNLTWDLTPIQLVTQNAEAHDGAVTSQ
jgi:hypothetical protein